MQSVLVTTEHRGVFYGETSESLEQIVTWKVVSLKNARMAIYWGTTRGVAQLADEGPTEKSRIGSKADCAINAVTGVWLCSPAAAAKWKALP